MLQTRQPRLKHLDWHPLNKFYIKYDVIIFQYLVIFNTKMFRYWPTSSGHHRPKKMFCILRHPVADPDLEPRRGLGFLLVDNLVLSAGLIMWIGYCKLTFRALALRRRANARNVSFWNSLRWPIHIINPVDKTKSSCYTSHQRSTPASLETYPFLLVALPAFLLLFLLFCPK